MQTFPQPKPDQPSVNPPTDNAFVALAFEAHCALARLSRTIFHGQRPIGSPTWARTRYLRIKGHKSERAQSLMWSLRRWCPYGW